jgi:TIR domain
MLRSLLPYLQQLQFQSLAEIWTDQDLKGGDEWRAEIEQALDSATVAVLLISQEFLTSRFICDEELPRILLRQLGGTLTVLPVYLSPSTVTSTTISFFDEQGFRREAILSNFQGFGTPDKTIKELPPTERNRRFLKLHDRIRELARSAPKALRVGQPPADPAACTEPPSQIQGTARTECATNLPYAISAPDTSRMPAHFTPSGVILDRHYAYTLTSYTNDGTQRASAELAQKYNELFDALTCSILLFDEVYLEQHHVSSLESNLDPGESDAFFKIFTPFSLLEDLGSPREQVELQKTIKNDMDDSELRPLLARYYGRRTVQAENSKELIFYLNRILARAQYTNTALFVRSNRMPLFRYKLGLDGAVKECISTDFLSIALELPVRRCRRLDDLAALRLDPNRGVVRAAISERVRRWAQQHFADSEVGARGSLEQVHPLTALATESEFVIGIRLEAVRLCGQPEAPSRYLLAASMG